MKICFFGNATSIHVQRWATWFADKGDEVHVFTFVDGKIENVNIHYINIELKHLPYPHAYFLISLPLKIERVKKAVREIKPDIVHGHYLSNYGLYAACTGFHPLVLSAWGSDVLVDPQRYPFLGILIKYALRRADLITCDGENAKEEMVKLGAKREKIRLIYFGVDTQRFNPKQRDGKLRQELGVANSPTVISTRNLRPLYDVESLINAIPLVLREVPEAKFIIAGDGEQRDYLESLASSLEVSDSIRFVGWIAHGELSKYLALADIYVSTSLSDGGISISTLEAMACKLPVVITDSGDNRRWVTDGENGFIIPTKAPNKLAERLVYLLQTPDIRKKFGEVNRRIIEEKSNYVIEMEKMERLYQQLIKEWQE